MAQPGNDGIDCSSAITAGKPSSNKLPGGASGHGVGGNPSSGSKSDWDSPSVGQENDPKTVIASKPAGR